MSVDLRLGDCLQVMPELPVVDAIITDLPYGTTACAWDSIIPLQAMWEQVRRVLKWGGVFVTTAGQPFTSALVMSNPNWFKYEMIYEKTNAKGFLSAGRRPLTAHENILVFYSGAATYNPQKWRVPEYLRTKRKHATHKTAGEAYGEVKMQRWDDDGTRQPTSVIGVSNHANRKGNFHPTQKPVELLRYLVLTYTNPGDTVLDLAMGSGTTGLACIETGRNFIGIEQDEDYFELAHHRVTEAQQQLTLFTAAPPP